MPDIEYHNIEFFDIAVNTLNTEVFSLDCDSIATYNEETGLSIDYDRSNKVLSIFQHNNTIARSSDVNLEYYKEEPSDMGIIFSHINKAQFAYPYERSYKDAMINSEDMLATAMSKIDEFAPGALTITGTEKDSKHTNLVNIDYSQFISCS